MIVRFLFPFCFWPCILKLFHEKAYKNIKLVTQNWSNKCCQTENKEEEKIIIHFFSLSKKSWNTAILVHFHEFFSNKLVSKYYILTLTNPKKCSLAGNKSDPISFSNWEALAPFKTKSNILMERPGDLRFWCSISAERFDPKCPLSMAVATAQIHKYSV